MKKTVVAGFHTLKPVNPGVSVFASFTASAKTSNQEKKSGTSMT